MMLNAVLDMIASCFQVIPTDDGEIIKTEDVITDSSGTPVGRERTVEEVETLPGKDSLSSMEDFW